MVEQNKIERDFSKKNVRESQNLIELIPSLKVLVFYIRYSFLCKQNRTAGEGINKLNLGVVIPSWKI